jgi:predicted TPR repeat methyltransferase
MNIKKAVSLFVLMVFLFNQTVLVQAQTKLSPALLHDDNLGIERTGVDKSVVARRLLPGAIGRGESLVELVSEKPEEAELTNQETIWFHERLIKAVDLAIVLSIKNKHKVPIEFFDKSEQALSNLIALQRNLKEKIYLFKPKIRETEDYLLGFNAHGKIGLDVDLVPMLLSVSLGRLAQYVYHECISENADYLDGMKDVLEEHRKNYGILQSAIFGPEEVAAFKSDLRRYIDNHFTLNDGYWENNRLFEIKKEEDDQPAWFFEVVLDDKGTDAEILELGCGSGRAMIKMNELGFNNVRGMDINPYFLDMAIKRGINPDNLTRANLKDFNFPSELDFVWASDILLYLDKENMLDAVFDRITSSLKDEGYLGLRWAKGEGKYLDKGTNAPYIASREDIAELLERHGMEAIIFEYRTERIYRKTSEEKDCTYWYVLARKKGSESYKDVYAGDEVVEARSRIVERISKYNVDPRAPGAANVLKGVKEDIDIILGQLKDVQKEEFQGILDRYAGNPQMVQKLKRFLYQYTHLGIRGVAHSWPMKERGADLLGFGLRTGPEENYDRQKDYIVRNLANVLGSNISELYRNNFVRNSGVEYEEVLPDMSEKDLIHEMDVFQKENFSPEEIEMTSIIALLHDAAKLLKRRVDPITGEVVPVPKKGGRVEDWDISSAIYAQKTLSLLGYQKQRSRIVEFVIYHQDYLWSIMAPTDPDVPEQKTKERLLRNLDKMLDKLNLQGEKRDEAALTCLKLLAFFFVLDVPAGSDRYLRKDMFVELRKLIMAKSGYSQAVLSLGQIHQSFVRSLRFDWVGDVYYPEDGTIPAFYSRRDIRRSLRLNMLLAREMGYAGEKMRLARLGLIKHELLDRIDKIRIAICLKNEKDGKYNRKDILFDFISLELLNIKDPEIIEGEETDDEKVLKIYRSIGSDDEMLLIQYRNCLNKFMEDKEELARTSKLKYLTIDEIEELLVLAKVADDFGTGLSANKKWKRRRGEGDERRLTVEDFRQIIEGSDEFDGIEEKLRSSGAEFSEPLNALKRLLRKKDAQLIDFVRKLRSPTKVNDSGKEEIRYQQYLVQGDLDYINSLLSPAEESLEKVESSGDERSITDNEIKYMAEFFKNNLISVLSEKPETIFTLAIDTDIGKNQSAQIMAINMAISRIKRMEDEGGKLLFPNLLVKRFSGTGDRGHKLMAKLQDLMDDKESGVKAENIMLIAKQDNLEAGIFGALEGISWITGLDDSSVDRFNYLPVMESITLTAMAVLNADTESIKYYYDQISDGSIDLASIEEMLKKRIIKIIPKACKMDPGELRKTYERVRDIYLAV